MDIARNIEDFLISIIKAKPECNRTQLIKNQQRSIDPSKTKNQNRIKSRKLFQRMKFLGFSIMAILLAGQYKAQPTIIESKMQDITLDKNEATGILGNVRDYGGVCCWRNLVCCTPEKDMEAYREIKASCWWC